MTEREFWMVWSPEGHAPTVQHASHDAARQEAARLAAKVPGRRFYVLRGVERVQTQNVVITPLEGGTDVPSERGHNRDRAADW